MESPTKIPRSAIFGIILAIVLDTVIQPLWKLGVSDVAENASIVSTALAALSNKYFYFAMLAFAAQMVNWLKVLAQADLSFAQPFTALSYVTVLAISSYTLHEQISPMHFLGVSVILIGVYLISRTSHSTTNSDKSGPLSTVGNGTNGG
jgi:drug/metabolite transporter (DMT)-like permease